MPEILKLVNFYYSKLHFYQTTAEKEKVYHVNPKSLNKFKKICAIVLLKCYKVCSNIPTLR